LLLGLYAVSLASELICNDRPILLRHRGRTFLPVFRAYTQDRILGNGIQTRMTDYRSLWQSPDFATNRASWAVLPPVPYGPHENLRQADFDAIRRVTVAARPVSRTARVQLGVDGRVVWAEGAIPHFFPGAVDADAIAGRPLAADWPLPEALAAAVRQRLDSATAAPAAEAVCAHATDAALQARVRLVPTPARTAAPTSVRLIFRDPQETSGRQSVAHAADIEGALADWTELTSEQRVGLAASARAAFTEYVPPTTLPWRDTTATVDIAVETVAWPFRPVPGHWLGVDMAGRDVLARLLYGLRTSMTFGLLLVVASVVLGIVAGAVQGYFAGWTDILGQRLTEIWSALPFLYVMILLGNSLGRSFVLLLLCYAAFNWIGISSYIRAEYLRLRVRPFVDAARSQGLRPGRIMLRHILPNALTPLITLFPFELVGAIGSLAALDYLGFGLPDGTPSWGELLHQAQLVRQAWWLILYPSLALFTVMILGVFIGEGLREAFDPKEYSRQE
jgi:microcin C transport system permease protein